MLLEAGVSPVEPSADGKLPVAMTRRPETRELLRSRMAREGDGEGSTRERGRGCQSSELKRAEGVSERNSETGRAPMAGEKRGVVFQDDVVADLPAANFQSSRHAQTQATSRGEQQG